MKAQYLKKILIALSILFLFSYSNNVFAQPDLIIQVKSLKKNRSEEFKPYEGKLYTMSIDMINNSDTTIRFWRMYILEASLISNDSNIIPFGPRIIDINYYLLQHIDNRQKITMEAVLQVKYPLKDIKNHYYRLGFVFVYENEVDKNGVDLAQVLYNKTKEGKDIIWSVPFKITK